jgi:hypothetical protein
MLAQSFILKICKQQVRSGNQSWLFCSWRIWYPNGRPKGSRNRRTQEILDLLQARGDKDPLDALSDIVTKNQDPAIVAQAANMLAPYVHSKRGAAVPPRFLGEPVQVPDFTSIEDAEKFLADLPQRVGRGELDFQSGLDLSTLTRNWISARYEREELQLKLTNSPALSGDQTIHIQGGLPPLPGTDIIMPEINGALNGKTIEHEPGPPAIEATQSNNQEENAGTAPLPAKDQQP